MECSNFKLLQLFRFGIHGPGSVALLFLYFMAQPSNLLVFLFYLFDLLGTVSVMFHRIYTAVLSNLHMIFFFFGERNYFAFPDVKTGSSRMVRKLLARWISLGHVLNIFFQG